MSRLDDIEARFTAHARIDVPDLVTFARAVESALKEDTWDFETVENIEKAWSRLNGGT